MSALLYGGESEAFVNEYIDDAFHMKCQ